MSFLTDRYYIIIASVYVNNSTQIMAVLNTAIKKIINVYFFNFKHNNILINNYLYN